MPLSAELLPARLGRLAKCRRWLMAVAYPLSPHLPHCGIWNARQLSQLPHEKLQASCAFCLAELPLKLFMPFLRSKCCAKVLTALGSPAHV